MENNQDLERMLENLQKPELKEGPHRQLLKYSLMNQFNKGKVPMKSWKKTLAWAACLLLIIAVGGVTAQQIINVFTTKFKAEKQGGDIITPKGEYIGAVGRTEPETIYSTKTNDPSMTDEKAQRIHREIKELIDKGKYSLTKITPESSGDTTFTYKFTLSDGTIQTIERGQRYIPKVDPSEIGKLYEEGRYKLYKTEVKANGDTMYYYLFTRHDGSTFDIGGAALKPLPKK